jgi:hypothetical protein
MSSYLEQIEDLIKFHNKKLAELEIARAVIAELTAEQKPHKAKPSKQSVTIRRVAPSPAAPSPAADTGERDKIREVALTRLRQGEVVNSSNLIKEFGLVGKQAKQHVYQALYDLKTQGHAVRLEGTPNYVLQDH